MVLEVIATLLVGIATGESVALWFVNRQLREAQRQSLELSTQLLAIQSGPDQYSDGYNKGRTDAEKLYEKSGKFLTEHYGNLVGHMETMTSRKLIQHTEQESIFENSNIPAPKQPKLFQVSPVLTGTDGDFMLDVLGKS